MLQAASSLGRRATIPSITIALIDLVHGFLLQEYSIVIVVVRRRVSLPVFQDSGDVFIRQGRPSFVCGPGGFLGYDYHVDCLIRYWDLMALVFDADIFHASTEFSVLAAEKPGSVVLCGKEWISGGLTVLLEGVIL